MPRSPRHPRRPERTLSVLLQLALILGTLIIFSADRSAADASSVFELAKPRLVQVRILENATDTKSVIGSGFFATPELVVTNYHVISELVHKPNSYRARVVSASGEEKTAQLAAIDVVSDLAVLRTEAAPELNDLDYQNNDLKRGTRVYALGNPHDLGLTIVEGTFNGLIDNSMYEKVHFTGSLNSGMSGGPAITEDLKLVGVNVSTAGDQLSFLVPAKKVVPLIEQAKAGSQKNFQQVVAAQLIHNQKNYVGDLLKAAPESIELGSYSLPGAFSKSFRCWGDMQESETARFVLNSQNCGTEDSIFVSNELSAGVLEYEHQYLTSNSLNRFQFYYLLTELFTDSDSVPSKSIEDDVTNFKCEEKFVELSSIQYRVATCMRAYKKHRGLYDLAVRAASVNQNSAAVISKLDATGLSFESATELTAHYLRQLKWKP